MAAEDPTPAHVPPTPAPDPTRSAPDPSNTKVQADRRSSGTPRSSESDNFVDLRIRILEDPSINVVYPSVFQRYPLLELQCPVGLKEAEFLHLLRSTFPQLTGEAFDFLAGHGRKIKPLKVENLTPEEISRSFGSIGGSVLYIRLKKQDEVQARALKRPPALSDRTRLSASSDTMAAVNETYCDSDGSDLELEGNDQQNLLEEDIVGDVPEDPLDKEQEWNLFGEDEDEDEEFVGFQVGWQTAGFRPRRQQKFTRTPGLKVPISEDASPLDVFSHIFTDEVWDMLVTQTNVYADQVRSHTPSNSKWSPVSKQEMKSFIGLCLTFGIIKLPTRRDYWRQSKWLYQTNVARVMARDRFDMIWRYLHLQDNTDPAVDKSDRLWKLRCFLDLLLNQYQALYEVNGIVTVDESMVKYKGRLAFRQYLPMKPVKWGVKVWVMAESKTGYVTSFQVYTGAIEGKAELNLAHRIVTDLVSPYYGSHLSVYMDNFYTSVPLLVDLNVRGVGACGTVRANRRGLPKNKELSKQAGMARNQYRVAQQDKLTLCVWQDTKAVMVLSNHHDPMALGTVKRRVEDQRQVEVEVPACLADYQQHMKGVDLLDQMVGYYTLEHRSLKWWRRLFFYFLSVTCYNSFVAARSAGGDAWKYRKVGYKAWLEDLTMELCVPVTKRSAPHQLLPTSPSTSTASTGHDLAKINKKRKTCRECSKDNTKRQGTTLMGCRQCNIPLHRECFMHHALRK
ncbi:piggyBac transposable element-derived protein 4-like isoform 1-T2 [Odontesthes bonariensis]